MKRFANGALVCALAMTFTGLAGADIMGFNNLTGWRYNQGDSGNPADLPNADTIRLTNLGTEQRRSVFYTTRQSITQFTTTFTYQATNAGVFGCDYGAAFVIQNSAAGAAALGGGGGGMGYSGIANSLAVTFELQNNASGLFTNGSIGSNGITVDPLNFTNAHPIAVRLDYNGTVLAETLRDTVTNQTINRSFVVGNLATRIGSPSAFVGFSASTTQGACSGNAANQYFSGIQFTAVPEPASTGIVLIVFMGAAMRRRA